MSEQAGRMAVVTGASGGIGRAIAVELGRLGWSVAVGARREDAREETVELVRGAGGEAFAYALDVSDPDSVDEFFDHAEAELGGVSAVVNNAASARYGPVWEFPAAQIQAEIAVKLTGSILVARRAIRSMLDRDHQGDVLFITSTSAASPWPHHLPYVAANVGVEHAAKTLKLELEGTGIRVHTFRCDSTIGTDFATAEHAAGRMIPAMEVWYRHGLQRHFGYLTTEQVAGAVAGALSLPAGVQYDLITLTPVAPRGPLPTWDEFEATL